MEALQQPSIRVIAVIAEGVPEGDTKQLIAYAAKHNKIVLGPATVGGLQVQPFHWLALAFALTSAAAVAFALPLCLSICF